MTNDEPVTDDELVAAYVLRDMDEAERLRFEERLAIESMLAERVARFEALDLAAAAARLAPAGRNETPQPPAARYGPLLLAALVLLGIVMFASSDVAPECRVRAVSSCGEGSLREYATGIGLPESVAIPTVDRRGTESTAPVPAAPFLAAAAVREAERSVAELAGPQRPVERGFFTLRLRADRECDVVVVQLDAAERLQRLFPSPPGRAVYGETPSRVPAHTVVTLPRPVVLPNAIGGLSMHPGFDVPSDLAVRRVWLVVALRTHPVADPELADLDRFLAAPALPSPGQSQDARDFAVEARLAATRTWLEQRGFSTTRLDVEGR